MTYDEFVQYMARYGFIGCPLTLNQYIIAKDVSDDIDFLYGLACDVNAGIDFGNALIANKPCNVE